MTISASDNRISDAGNDVTTEFPFPYKFLADEDLVVLLVTNSTGVSVTQVLTTNYTVAGAGDAAGGTVTMVTPPATGESLIVYSDPAIAQGTDFVDNSALPAESLENGLDLLTLITRRLKDLSGRTLRQPDSDSDGLLTIPTKQDRAGKLMSFDVNGDPVATVGDPGTATGLMTSLASTALVTEGAAMIGNKREATGAVGTDLHEWIEGRSINPKTDFAAPIGSDATTELQAAIDAMVAGDTLEISDDYIHTGLNITNKSRIRITGKGKLTLQGAASGAIAIEFLGTCDDVEIDAITIYGENNAAYSQHGIGNISGQTLSRINIHGVKIKEINVGIGLTGGGGSCSKVDIWDNDLLNIIGTGSGQGYGITLDTVTDHDVFNNVTDTTSRHAIYIAEDCTGDVHDNRVLNHRAGVADATYRAAISLARSNHVNCYDNEIVDFWDSGIGIEHVTVDSKNCSYVRVWGNKFRGRNNAPPAIYVGEQGVPTSYFTSHITIWANEIYEDFADVSGNPSIFINNGRDITVRDNTIVTVGVTGTCRHITVGNASYIGATDDCTRVRVYGNTHVFEGSTLTDTRANVIDVDISTTYSPEIHIGPGKYTGTSDRVSFDGAWTNTNLTVENPEGVRIGVYADGDATPSVFGNVTDLSLVQTGATDITALDDGIEGQQVTLIADSTNTTIKTSGFYLKGNVDFVMALNSTLTVRKRGLYWVEVARMEF